MFFHWSLSDNKSPQVSRTILNILAVLNNVVVWMVFTAHTKAIACSFKTDTDVFVVFLNEVYIFRFTFV